MNEKEMWLHWMKKGNVHIPVILLENYANMGMKEEEIMLLLHIHANIENGINFPTPLQLAETMAINVEQLSFHLRSLIQRGLLAILEDKREGIIVDAYSLDPLWLSLYDFIQKKERKESRVIQSEENLFSSFEKEFGRALSPIECETLTMWYDQDHHDSVIIKAALKEAVLAGKLSFRYIDRILFEWKKQGIDTIEQAREQSKKFKKTTNRKKPEPEKGATNQAVPFYNWLDES
jgi:DNA replication protein